MKGDDNETCGTMQTHRVLCSEYEARGEAVQPVAETEPSRWKLLLRLDKGGQAVEPIGSDLRD